MTPVATRRQQAEEAARQLQMQAEKAAKEAEEARQAEAAEAAAAAAAAAARATAPPPETGTPFANDGSDVPSSNY